MGAPSLRNVWAQGLAWASLVDTPHGRGCRALGGARWSRVEKRQLQGLEGWVHVCPGEASQPACDAPGADASPVARGQDRSRSAWPCADVTSIADGKFHLVRAQMLTRHFPFSRDPERFGGEGHPRESSGRLLSGNPASGRGQRASRVPGPGEAAARGQAPPPCPGPRTHVGLACLRQGAGTLSPEGQPHPVSTGGCHHLLVGTEGGCPDLGPCSLPPGAVRGAHQQPGGGRVMV